MAKESKIPPQQSTGMVNLPTPPAKKASDYLRTYDGWVYASINAIAQEVANIRLHLYRRIQKKSGTEFEEVKEHEAISLLRNVNDYMTSYQLIELTQIFLEQVGEAYWCVIRGEGGRPEQLWILRPDWVYVVKSETTFIDKYIYSPNGYYARNSVTIDAKDVIPFKYPNPTDPYRGHGAVQSASSAIDTDKFASEYNRNFFYNSAIPYLLLRTKRKPSKPDIDRFISEWEGKLQGRGNAHKIAMLTGDWEEPFEFGGKMKDLDFNEGRKAMRDEILAIFKVGKSTLNITDDVNRANAEASNLNFMERTIKPKMTRLVAHLNEFYLAPNWPEEDIFFDYEDPSPTDVEMNLKIYESAKGSWMTPNEIRERENLPPLEGGDVIYQPIILAPMGTASFDSGATPDPNTEDDAKEQKIGVIKMTLKTKDGKEKVHKFMMPIPPKRLEKLRKEKEKKELKHDLFKLVKNLITEVTDEQLKQKKARRKIKGHTLAWTKEQRDAHWDKMVAKTDVFENRMQGKAKELFDAQEKEVKRNLESSKHYSPSKRKDSASDYIFNVASENKKWRKVLAPIISTVVKDKGKEILEFLGVAGDLDLSQATASAYLRIEGLAFIKDVNDYTIERLKKVLAEGLEKEEGIPDLKKRVEQVFDVAKGSRSEMIARTEVLRSTNFATEEAFKQSEVVEGKEWLTAKDERVDDECADLDGDTAELGDDFKGVGFPPLHPNCRCTILPVLK